MRCTSVIATAALALSMTAGSIRAADDSFSYNGYGRTGFTLNQYLNGSGNPWDDGAAQSKRGRLGNEFESNYFEQAFSKKWTADNNLWSKMTFTMGYYNGSPNGDENSQGWNCRQFYAEMGGLSFLTEGASMWLGQRYYMRHDIHVFDLFYTNFSGIGVGFDNLFNNMLSAGFITEGSGKNIAKLGEQKVNNIIAEIKPSGMFDIDAAFGFYAGRDSKDDTIKVEGANGISGTVTFKPPVFGLSVVGQVSTGIYAAPMGTMDHMSTIKGAATIIPATDTIKKKGDQVSKELFYRVLASTVTDVGTITVAPAVGFQGLAQKNKGTVSMAPGDTADLTTTTVYGTLRLQVKLGQNVSWAPTGGFYYTKHDRKVGSDTSANTTFSVTPVSFIFGIDNGFWTRPQFRLYATYAHTDKDHTFGGAYAKKQNAIYVGGQMEVWW